MTCEGDSSSTVQRWPHPSIAKELRMQLAADKVTRAPSDYSSFSKHLLALGDPRTFPSIWRTVWLMQNHFIADLNDPCLIDWLLRSTARCRGRYFCAPIRKLRFGIHRLPGDSRSQTAACDGRPHRANLCCCLFAESLAPKTMMSPDKLIRVKSWAILINFGFLWSESVQIVLTGVEKQRGWKMRWQVWTLVKLQNLITIKINEHHFRQELGYCILELWMWWGGPNSQYPNCFPKNRPSVMTQWPGSLWMLQAVSTKPETWLCGCDWTNSGPPQNQVDNP